MFTEGVWGGSSRPQQASDPLKGSTVCSPSTITSTGGTPATVLSRNGGNPPSGSAVSLSGVPPPTNCFTATQLSHRVAVRAGGNGSVQEPCSTPASKGMRESGVWGKVPPGINSGFYKPISFRSENKHFLIHIRRKLLNLYKDLV